MRSKLLGWAASVVAVTVPCGHDQFANFAVKTQFCVQFLIRPDCSGPAPLSNQPHTPGREAALSSRLRLAHALAGRDSVSAAQGTCARDYKAPCSCMAAPAKACRCCMQTCVMYKLLAWLLQQDLCWAEVSIGMPPAITTRVTGNGLTVLPFRIRFRFLPLGRGKGGTVSTCMQCMALADRK